MPLLVKLPRIDETIQDPGYLDVMDRKKTAVQRQLRRAGLGGYEPEFLSTMLALGSRLDPGFVFYDVGSHIGFYSALMEKLFDAQATAFEATPETAAGCRQLRDKNDLQYRVVETAISNSTGEVEFYLSPKAETSNSLNSKFRPGATSIKVPLTTLDEVSSNQPSPQLVKIDVETHEPQVLLGAKSLITSARPIIACEILPQTDTPLLIEALSFLGSLDYKFYHVNSTAPWSPVGSKEVIESIDHEGRDWVLSPAPLDEFFFEVRERWIQALHACGSDTNIIVPPKRKAPRKSSFSEKFKRRLRKLIRA